VRVTATCTLTVGNNTQTRTAFLNVDGTSGDLSSATLPLELAGGAGASSVACTATVPTGSTLPTVSATGDLNALATAGSTAGTSTTTTTATTTTAADAAH
jgi:hypothetical protein